MIKRNSDISTKKAQGYYKDIETADKALKAFFDEVGW